MNLEVTLAGKKFKNPVTTASGTFGSGAEYEQFVDLAALGAVTTKGVANVPWEGNPTPRVAETYGGMLNAVGLQNPGYELFAKRDITCIWIDHRVLPEIFEMFDRIMFIENNHISCGAYAEMIQNDLFLKFVTEKNLNR